MIWGLLFIVALSMIVFGGSLSDTVWQVALGWVIGCVVVGLGFGCLLLMYACTR